MMRAQVQVPEKIEYPTIEPVPEGVHRPQWSVMIPTYNCAHYLRRTLESLLSQDPGPEQMQIEVVDDRSTLDDPETVVKEVGKGRVSFFRQPHNVGVSRNFTTCIQRAQGHWVHILHGDDMLMPGFYEAYGRLIDEVPDVAMVFCPVIQINENDERQSMAGSVLLQSADGIIENAAYELRKVNFVYAPTVAIRREIFTKVGGFLSILPHCGDWEMWMRIAEVGRVGYIDHPYLLYRIHVGSDTNTLAQSAKNIEDTLRAIEIGLRRLPRHQQAAMRTIAYKNCAQYASNFRHAMHQQQNYHAGLRHAQWAFTLDPSVRRLVQLLLAAVMFYTRAFIGFDTHIKRR